MNHEQLNQLQNAFKNETKSNMIEQSQTHQNLQEEPYGSYDHDKQENIIRNKEHQLFSGDFKRTQIVTYQSPLHCATQTKTKWDTFHPYAFAKLSLEMKDETFLQLFDDYQRIKIKLNQCIKNNKKIMHRYQILQVQQNKLSKQTNLTANERIKLHKESNNQIVQYKLQIKRLHEKIIALTGNKIESRNNPKTKVKMRKTQKNITPYNQDIKMELQIEKKHVRQLLLIVDQFKKNKFFMENQLKQSQIGQSKVTGQHKLNKKSVKGDDQSQFQQYAYDLNNYKQKYSDLEISYQRMCQDKDNYIKQLSVQIVELKDKFHNKTINNSNNHNKINTILNQDQQQKIQELEDENDRLERQVRKMVSQPFYQNNKQAIDTQHKYIKLQTAYNQSRQQVKKLHENNNKLLGEFQYKSKQINMIKQQNQRLKNQKKQLLQSKGQLNIDQDDYYRKLMAITKLNGQDPIWRKYSTFKTPNFGVMNEKQLKEVSADLWHNKLQLMSHLERAQIQIKTMKDVNQARLGTFIKDKQYLEEQLRIARARLDEWVSMDKLHHNRDLKIYQQSGINYDDTVSVFEVDEGEIKNLQNAENFFDLYLGQLKIDQYSFENNMLTGSNLVTFLTIDFYNHETQHSNFAEGMMKNLANNYSFRVDVNAYFLKYLSKNFISLELWSPQGTTTILMGKGRIQLRNIVNNASRDVSAVIRGNCPIYSSSYTYGDHPVASVQYRIRMRLPITPMLEWVESNSNIKVNEKDNDPFAVYHRKKMTITIQRANKLASGINAFVYFTIQNEDYFTQPVRGPSPLWDFHQQINILVNDELQRQFKQNYIKFTIFDDDKQVNEDIVGIAKASFTPLLETTDQLNLNLDIKNNDFDTIGQLIVQVSWI